MMNKAYLNNYEDKNNPHNNKYNQIRIKKSDTTERLNWTELNVFLQMPTLCYA